MGEPVGCQDIVEWPRCREFSHLRGRRARACFAGVRADGLACHVDAVGEMLLFHCDLCGETLPTHRLHRCSRACNFDVCHNCIDPELHTFE